MMAEPLSDQMDVADKIKYLKTHITSYPDFPKPGILFRDFFSLLRRPEASTILKDVLLHFIQTEFSKVQAIVGLEARGFLLGTFLALELKVPFIPVRKPGKLPGEIYSVSYEKEYGTDIFEMQKDSIEVGRKVLIVDDLLATGGSLKAACQLVEKAGGIVLGCLVVMELVELKGRELLDSKIIPIMKY